MRKAIKYLLLVSIILVSNYCYSADLTTAQKKFQTELMNFLTDDGFAPYIDTDDNSVCFKKEGELHWIIISNESPFFIVFRRVGFSLEGENALNLISSLLACNEVNKEEAAVKMYCTDKSVLLGVESFTRSIEDFKYVFYSSLKVLNSANDTFITKYREFEDNDKKE